MVMMVEQDSQTAIDAIMDEVEKKMDCLEAIQKHNQVSHIWSPGKYG